MMRGRTVAVIGLGLMGGSLARDLAAAGSRVLGHDAEPGFARRALADGVLAAVLDDAFTGIGAADLVVIATPVDAIPRILDRVSPLLGPGAAVTDVGSTKGVIVAHAEAIGLGDRFIGSHPVAGDHRSGWEASRSGLYRGVPVHLCPTTSTAPAVRSLVEACWTELGAHCSTMSAAAHDTIFAWVSHLPQVASSAVAGALADFGARRDQLGPGGRDVTRLAASSPEMWVAICLSERAAIGEAVGALGARLDEFRAALERGDAEALRRFFEAGRAWTG